MEPQHQPQTPPGVHLPRTDLDTARRSEGCPLGTDEALLALSDPPLYTPFPSPFLEDFISASPRPRVSASPRPPLAVDISEGKTDPAYMAQTYHTKVPHRAIARYIEHYTDPGDLVMDGFCGSGTVGIAANQKGRRALLCDLSPAATFLAHSLCHPVDLAEARHAVASLLLELERECGWLYQGVGGWGLGVGDLVPNPLDYVIWSEVFRCPGCSVEFPFAEAGFDFAGRRPHPQLDCPACGSRLHPNHLLRSLDGTGRTKEVPVRVAYTGVRRPRETAPNPEFFELQDEIERLPIPYWYPDNPMMNLPPGGGGWGDMWRRGYHSGMERVPDFYFKRTLWVLATAMHLASGSPAQRRTRHLMMQVIVNASTAFTRMRRAYQGVLPLVLYVPKLKREVNVIRGLADRFRTVLDHLSRLRTSNDVLITTQSTTSLPNVPDGCVDYIFTDPPFGDNIRYSEVNFLWEAWLRVFTNQGPEAIISGRQRKDVDQYRELMHRSFAEMHRVLKPGRWITVAFHNSDSRVWNAIQGALRDAGFDVEGVALLDKRQVSFKQASANTVRRDLVISARRSETIHRPSRPPAVGDVEGAWEMVRDHLGRLPLPSLADRASAAARGGLELFNRMVAFHVERGLPVPMDVERFRLGLPAHFEEREGMYFLPEQAADYDRLVASSDTKV